ncbi:unnamed protein product [Rhodiola kirilowii]
MLLRLADKAERDCDAVVAGFLEDSILDFWMIQGQEVLACIAIICFKSSLPCKQRTLILNVHLPVSCSSLHVMKDC